MIIENNIKIELSLNNCCIHTAAKKYQERAVFRYFTNPGVDQDRLEKEIDNLKYFLENVDAGQMRSRHPELSGKSIIKATLIIIEQPKMWQIQFLDQIVDVIWK
jgi:hypothetical protein